MFRLYEIRGRGLGSEHEPLQKMQGDSNQGSKKVKCRHERSKTIRWGWGNILRKCLICGEVYEVEGRR